MLSLFLLSFKTVLVDYFALVKLNPSIVWKYFGNIVEKGWKIQFPQFCPIPQYGNILKILQKKVGKFNFYSFVQFHNMEIFCREYCRKKVGKSHFYSFVQFHSREIFEKYFGKILEKNFHTAEQVQFFQSVVDWKTLIKLFGFKRLRKRILCSWVFLQTVPFGSPFCSQRGAKVSLHFVHARCLNEVNV